MVSRRRGVVDSQQDVRQVMLFPNPGLAEASHAVTFCAFCKICGCKFGCLKETLPASTVNSKWKGGSSWFDSHLIKQPDDWSPSLGPCCEDCFEHLKAKVVTYKHKSGRDLTDEKDADEKSVLRHLWETVCGLLHTIQGAFARRPVFMMDGVQPEAEGFLEVQIVVSRHGSMQHLEIDFPADIRIDLLKEELAALIDVPGPAQHWFYLADELEGSLTLEEAHVDTGAVIEVKCLDSS